eukprot:scaffold6978_cov64-Phaeocystis_antarctica.AAC.4
MGALLASLSRHPNSAVRAEGAICPVRSCCLSWRSGLRLDASTLLSCVVCVVWCGVCCLRSLYQLFLRHPHSSKGKDRAKHPLASLPFAKLDP